MHCRCPAQLIPDWPADEFRSCCSPLREVFPLVRRQHQIRKVLQQACRSGKTELRRGKVAGDIDKLLSTWDQWGWHRVTAYGDLKEPVRALADRIGFAVVDVNYGGSTGFGRGVALPHARLEGLKRPVAALLRLEAPVGFAAADGMQRLSASWRARRSCSRETCRQRVGS